MKLFRPRSILRLILTGFALVALPLIVALVVATVSVDRMMGHSQQALLQSVLVTQASQTLVEAIKAMERNARQYQVLGDQVLFDVYDENHSRLIDTARSFEALEITADQRMLLQELQVVENELHTALVSFSFDAPELVDVMPLFVDLGGLAQNILVESQQLITRGVDQMQQDSGDLQRTLVIQALALVPAALLLTLLFTFLISRPVRQIDRTIRRLGDGIFSESAEISGPRDLEQLGVRLDWLRDRLLELEQDKTRFLQHMSHELKTPLTAIREGTELLREQIVGELNEKQLEIAGILHDNSLKLQKLIEDLLNFSILQSRTAALAMSPVDLQVVVEEVLEEHKIAMMSRQLVPETSLQSVGLTGDREKLRTLVDNLVSNAVKYSPDNSQLAIRLYTSDGMAVIDVTDAGPGIPEEDFERVFEAFYQGKPADRGPIRGTGLGLSIAREYARAHGGDVSVVKLSQAGACLRVVLPLAQE